MQGRVAQGEPLPRVVLPRATLPRKVKGGHYDDGEESRTLRATLAFLVGLEGGYKGEGMPRDVFRGVFMDLLMPLWDPLRQKPDRADRLT